MGYTFPSLALENGEYIQMGYKCPSLALKKKRKRKGGNAFKRVVSFLILV